MVRVGKGHNVIGKAEIQVLQVDVTGCISGIVPRGIHLVPVAIHLHRIPYMPISRNAAVFDSGLFQQKRITAIVGFARSQATRRQSALNPTVHIGLFQRLGLVHVVVVRAVVKHPIMQPQRLLVIGRVALPLALGHYF